MTHMNRRAARPLVIAAALLVASGVAAAQSRTVDAPDAPRSLTDAGPVAVQWTDPGEFTDLKFSGNRWEARRGNWVVTLAEHLRKSVGKQLPEGERMEVTITDIDRAGHYEPWHGMRMQDVRILRDVYPPSMSLTFKRYDANGELVAEGERKLRDLNYLHGAPSFPSSDSLRHEKRLIDDWVRDEFRNPALANR